MTGSQQTTNHGSPIGTRRAWTRRLFGAQESGLVLVILAVMGLLTAFGGTKTRVDAVPIAPEATVAGAPGGDITVTRAGSSRTYPAADGWTLVERGPADARERVLRRERHVNKFFDAENLVLIAKDASFIAIMAVGMTGVIVMGGIDLSVGSVYALSALLGAKALRLLQAHALGLDPSLSIPSEGGAGLLLALPVGVLVCCAVGAACGAANGAMVVGLRVHPFIITLGTMAAIRGIVFVVTQGRSLTGIPDSFGAGLFKLEYALGPAKVYPVPMLLMLAVAVAGHVLLTRFVLGRRVFAIGGNETAARYAGIPVGRVKIIIYALCGMLAGLSACVYIGYYAAFEPNAGNGYELSVVAAAVIGGASLSGGRGSALGAVLGALLIQLINNAMIILDINSSYTNIVMGAAIIMAVVLDQLKTRWSGGAAR